MKITIELNRQEYLTLMAEYESHKEYARKHFYKICLLEGLKKISEGGNDGFSQSSK